MIIIMKLHIYTQLNVTYDNQKHVTSNKNL